MRDWLSLWRKQMRQVGYSGRDQFDLLYMFSGKFTLFHMAELGGWK